MCGYTLHARRALEARWRGARVAVGVSDTLRIKGWVRRNVTHFSVRHLYGARLRLHKKLNSKSCSSRDSLGTVVLGFSIFDSVRILRLRPQRSPTMHGHPSSIDAPPQRSQHRATLSRTSKSRKLQDNGYLKMAPCDSPLKTGIETNRSGRITQVWSLTHIYGNLKL